MKRQPVILTVIQRGYKIPIDEELNYRSCKISKIADR